MSKPLFADERNDPNSSMDLESVNEVGMKMAETIVKRPLGSRPTMGLPVTSGAMENHISGDCVYQEKADSGKIT